MKRSTRTISRRRLSRSFRRLPSLPNPRPPSICSRKRWLPASDSHTGAARFNSVSFACRMARAVIPSPSSCMAAAGSPGSDNCRRRRRRWTPSDLWPLPSLRVALPPGISSIAGSGMTAAAGRERTKTWPGPRTISVSWHQSIASIFSAWSSWVTRPGDTWRSGSRRGISCRQTVRSIPHLHCAWRAWLISTAHQIWSLSSASNARFVAHQSSSSCWAERPRNFRAGIGRPQRPGCCQLGRNRNC